MTPNSEYKLLRNYLSSNRFIDVSIGNALDLIKCKSKAIKRKRSESLDIQLNQQLMLSDIDKCNKILLEM